MSKAASIQLIFVLVVGILSVLKAEDPYKYYTWTVTYGTASPLGAPQQVTWFLDFVIGLMFYIVILDCLFDLFHDL